jgi:hypothetical protein
MSFTPENSAIRVDRNLEEKLKTASHEEIKELLKDAAVEQGAARREWDTSILTATELVGAAPRRFAKTEIVAGQKMVFEGDSEIEVERQIGAAYKTAAALAQPVVTPQQTEQPRGTDGRFVPVEQTVTDEQKAALSLQFQLGQISASEYI